jgi:drug/metabolite transporter (DMT)-like permease
VPAEKLLFYQVAVSSVVLPGLSLALGEAWTWDWSLRASVSIFIQTAVGAFASFLVWMWLLGHYPATRISAFVFLTPVFALVVGGLWLGEPITAGLVLALLLVTGGVFLVSRKG